MLKRLDSLPATMKLEMADAEWTLRCVVAGALGEKSKARAYLQKAQPFLRARKDPYWLDRCLKAAG